MKTSLRTILLLGLGCASLVGCAATSPSTPTNADEREQSLSAPSTASTLSAVEDASGRPTVTEGRSEQEILELAQYGKLLPAGDLEEGYSGPYRQSAIDSEDPALEWADHAVKKDVLNHWSEAEVLSAQELALDYVGTEGIDSPLVQNFNGDIGDAKAAAWYQGNQSWFAEKKTDVGDILYLLMATENDVDEAADEYRELSAYEYVSGESEQRLDYRTLYVSSVEHLQREDPGACTEATLSSCPPPFNPQALDNQPMLGFEIQATYGLRTTFQDGYIERGKAKFDVTVVKVGEEWKIFSVGADTVNVDDF